MNFVHQLLVWFFVLIEGALAVSALVRLFFGLAITVCLPFYSPLLFFLQRMRLGPVIDLTAHLKWMIALAVKLLLIGLVCLAVNFVISCVNHG
jgi:hypothetical protein